MKQLLSLSLAIMLLVGCVPAAPSPLPEGFAPDAASSAVALPAAAPLISFTDDDGREIVLEKPCERIVSLYSAHTENLFSLGAGDKIIGSHNTVVFPAEAAFIETYDYNGDPERVIAAEPDLVLIRPFITRKSPQFVQVLENAGLTVVSLYPERLSDFDDYIKRLAQLTGTENNATQRLADFHRELDEIATLTATVSEPQDVFFESTEINLRTVSPDSMAGLAIATAGGRNVAADAVAISEGGSIASFGVEKILELADEIDVYIAQNGAMNTDSSPKTISERPGFDALRAVDEGRVYIIDEKLISSPTFRYVIGVRELARFLYPELMDELADYRIDRIATRRDFANILLRKLHIPVYTVSSYQYYKQPQDKHLYGLLADITWQDADFHAIETVIMSGAMDAQELDGKWYFHPDEPITQQTPEVARLLDSLGLTGVHPDPAEPLTCEEIVMLLEPR